MVIGGSGRSRSVPERAERVQGSVGKGAGAAHPSLLNSVHEELVC